MSPKVKHKSTSFCHKMPITKAPCLPAQKTSIFLQTSVILALFLLQHSAPVYISRLLSLLGIQRTAAMSDGFSSVTPLVLLIVIKTPAISCDYKCASHLGERFISFQFILCYLIFTMDHRGRHSLIEHTRQPRLGEMAWQSRDSFPDWRHTKACVLKHSAKLNVSCKGPRSGPSTQQVLINTRAISEYLNLNSLFLLLGS